MLKTCSLILIILSFNTFALVGGHQAANSAVVRLSQCENIVSASMGTYHGCDDRFLATGAAISETEILTAGHFVSHFIFKPKDYFLKVMVEGMEYKLKPKDDFIIHLPKAYYKYEKAVRSETMKSKPAYSTCDTDIAIIELTRKGKAKLQFSDYYQVNKTSKNLINERVKMYGYGVYKLDLYQHKRVTLKSTLNWMLSLGGSSIKTWVKSTASDLNLRVGSNDLQRPSSVIKDLKSDKEMLAIKTYTYETDYYNSFMAHGDSGAPAVIQNEIIGVFCALNTYHYEDKIKIVNLITNTSSGELRRFWEKDLNYIKTIK